MKKPRIAIWLWHGYDEAVDEFNPGRPWRTWKVTEAYAVELCGHKITDVFGPVASAVGHVQYLRPESGFRKISKIYALIIRNQNVVDVVRDRRKEFIPSLSLAL